MRITIIALGLNLLLLAVDLILNPALREQAQFKKWLSLPIAYFVISTISLLYSQDLDHGFRRLETMLSFLVIPVLFVFRPISEEVFRKLLKGFVVTNLIVIGILLIFSLFDSLYISEHEKIIFDPRVLKLEDKSALESVNFGGNYFFYVHFSRFIHPSYFGMHVLFALCSQLYLYRKKESSLLQALIISTVFIGTIVLLSSKAIYLTTIALASIFSVWLMKKYSLKYKVVIILSGLLLISAFVSLNPRVKQEISRAYNAYFKSQNDQIYSSTNVRIDLWQSAVHRIKESPWTGYGIGDAFSELQKNSKARIQKKKALNAHNQYMETALQTGLIGVVLIFSMFGILIYNSIKYSEIELLLFMVIIASSLLFESMWYSFLGVIFFNFFYALLLVRKRGNTES